MNILSWGDALVLAFQEFVIRDVLGILPSILGALLLFVVGLLIARSIEFVIEKAVSAVKLDVALRKVGLDRYFERAGMHLNSGSFLGKITYWIVLLVFIVGIADIFALTTVSGFIRTALGWAFGNLFAAIIILIVSAFLGQFLKKIVDAAVAGAKIHSAKFLGTATWWVVMLFGFMAALDKLGVNTSFIQDNITNLVLIAAGSLGLAFGLAFGLGGKSHAEKLIGRIEDRIENR